MYRVKEYNELNHIGGFARRRGQNLSSCIESGHRVCEQNEIEVALDRVDGLWLEEEGKN